VDPVKPPLCPAPPVPEPPVPLDEEPPVPELPPSLLHEDTLTMAVNNVNDTERIEARVRISKTVMVPSLVGVAGGDGRT
jgi:hypothetical protein